MPKGINITQEQKDIMDTLKSYKVPQNIIAQAMGISDSAVSRNVTRVMVDADFTDQLERIKEEIRILMTKKTSLNEQIDKVKAEKDEIFQKFNDLINEKKRVNERLNLLYTIKNEAEVEYGDR